MAYSIVAKPNTDPPSSDYPYGNIRDNPGDNSGTPVNKLVYADFHQFFAKIMDEAGIPFNNLPDSEYSGFQYFEALVALQGGTLKKTIEIGGWDMQTNGRSTVIPLGSLGITASKIRAASFLIKSDSGVLYPNGIVGISSGIVGVYSGPAAALAISDSGGMAVVREGSGFFDDPAFSNAVINRGYIVLEYVL
jgi:hypothetical protein